MGITPDFQQPIHNQSFSRRFAALLNLYTSAFKEFRNKGI